MTTTRKKLASLEKCYSLGLFTLNGERRLLAASDKDGGCLLFDLEGNLKDRVWQGIGGTMSLVEIPGADGQFLATHRFYGPDDSRNAVIVGVRYRGEGDWEIKTLLELPFVHRFGFVERGGLRYLVACTLKSDHKYPGDWSSPGKVLAAPMPERFDVFSPDFKFDLKPVREGLLKNHGYYEMKDPAGDRLVISAAQGVFEFTPPEGAGKDWTIRELVGLEASDAALLDIDGDGEEELMVFSPFHGDTLGFYKKEKGAFRLVYAYPEKLDFLHAIFAGVIGGKPCFIAGCRGGEKSILVFSIDGEGNYRHERLDRDCGPANILVYRHGGRDVLAAANHETDEVDLYRL
jgi:hypothetical protein